MSWNQQAVSIAEKMKIQDDLDLHLKAKNYYRLSGYWFQMRILASERTSPKAKGREIRSERFDLGRSFNEVSAIYEWDKKLRQVLFSGCEEIEVAFRTQVGYYLGEKHPLAHREPAEFQEAFSKSEGLPAQLRFFLRKGRFRRSEYEQWLLKVDSAIKRERGSDDGIAHQLDKYGDVHIWSLVEILEFQTLIKIFKFMPTRDRQKIARYFGCMNPKELDSQLAAINNLRNKLAHHARIWNRNFSRAPVLATQMNNNYFVGIVRSNDSWQKFRLYPLICVIASMLKNIGMGDHWHRALRGHLAEFPSIPGYNLTSAGFPADWKSFSIWTKVSKVEVNHEQLPSKE